LLSFFSKICVTISHCESSCIKMFVFFRNHRKRKETENAESSKQKVRFPVFLVCRKRPLTNKILLVEFYSLFATIFLFLSVIPILIFKILDEGYIRLVSYITNIGLW